MEDVWCDVVVARSKDGLVGHPCCGLGGFFGSLFYVADMEGNASFASTDNHVRHFRLDDPKDVYKCRSIA